MLAPSAQGVVTGIALSDASVERGDTLVATVEGPTIGAVEVCFSSGDQRFCQVRSSTQEPVVVEWQVPQGARVGDWSAVATDTSQTSASADFRVDLLPPRVVEASIGGAASAVVEPDRLARLVLRVEDHTTPVRAEVAFEDGTSVVGPFAMMRSEEAPGHHRFQLTRTPIGLGLTLGDWDVVYRSTDAGGMTHEERLAAGLRVRDATPPSISSFLLRPTPVEVGQLAFLDVAASDNHEVAAVTVRLDTSAGTMGPLLLEPVDDDVATHRIGLPTDLPLGAAGYRIVVRDAAGNEAVREGLVPVQDTLAPHVSDVRTDAPFQAPDVQGRGGRVVVRATVADATLDQVLLAVREPGQAVRTVEMEVEGGSTWVSGAVYNRLGDHRFSVIARDRAGNEARSVERTFTVLENVPPVVEELWPPPGGTGPLQGQARVLLRDTDLVTTSVVVRVAAGHVADDAAPLAATAYTVETHTQGLLVTVPYSIDAGAPWAVSVRAQDEFSEVVHASWSFSGDAGIPSSTLVLPPGHVLRDGVAWIRGDMPISATALDAEGDAAVEYRVSAQRKGFALHHPPQGMSLWPDTLRLRSLRDVDVGDGAYTLHHRARDAAGNVEPERAQALWRDDTPPLLKVVRHGMLTQAVVVDGGVGLDQVQVEQLVAGVGWVQRQPVEQQGLLAVELEPVPRGQTVRYRWIATDLLGNEAAQGTRIQPLSFVHPNNAPVGTFSAPAAGQRVSREAQVAWNASDLDRDAVSTKLILRGFGQDLVTLAIESGASARTVWDTTKWPDGDYVLVLVASDGSAERETLLPVRIDNHAGSDVLGLRFVDPPRPGQSSRIEIETRRDAHNVTLVARSGDRTHQTVLVPQGGGTFAGELAFGGRGTYILTYRMAVPDGPVEHGLLGAVVVRTEAEAAVVREAWLLGATLILGATAMGWAGGLLRRVR